ncbi:hypothetical protein, partial [Levilactobacillus koreensis]|uniref:hypothetical protein n=1 Tax=Levilactobacillus koreensis TaxID=637971 RepID=UPI001F453D3C
GGSFALPAGRYGLERCEHTLKPRKSRVSKLGFLLSRQETPTKQNDAPEPISAGLSAYIVCVDERG